jgi:hypothetical protein
MVKEGPTTCASARRQRRTDALSGVILFAVTEFLGTGSQVPLLLIIDAI